MVVFKSTDLRAPGVGSARSLLLGWGRGARGSSRRILPLLAFAVIVACETDEPKERFTALAQSPAPAVTDAQLPSGDLGADELAVDLSPLFAGCPTQPVAAGDFTRAKLLNGTLACMRFQYCAFVSASQALDEAVTVLRSTPDVTNLASARAAFRAAFELWSEIETMQFGPVAATTLDTYFGAALRDFVYAWPATSRCRVEEQLVTEGYTQGTDLLWVSARGLSALDYLLFYEGTDTGCAPSSDTAARFAALSSEELALRKRAFAQALAHDLAQRAAMLAAVYASGSAFAEGFATAGAPGYGSEQEALNVVAFGLTYIDKELKDWKLGVATGLVLDAPSSEFEARFAGLSGRAVEANLRGFGKLYEGCGAEGEAIGFDDWLVSANHSDLDDSVQAAFQSALTLAQALPADLGAASSSQLLAMHEAVRALAVLLKAELLGAGSPLQLMLPTTIEGDTD